MPINSFIFGVAIYSRLIAATKAINHKNNERNSEANPLVNEITPDAANITMIVQSTKFKPNAFDVAAASAKASAELPNETVIAADVLAISFNNSFSFKTITCH